MTTSTTGKSAGSERAVESELRALRNGIDSFAAWLERNGSASHDPYDIWGTQYGLKARATYYRRAVAGLPLIAPLLLIEIFWPGLRRVFTKPDRFATADAQLLLAFLNLHASQGSGEHLQKARQLGEEMLQYSIPGYSGLGWGYPFDWQNQRGMWRKNTPFITCTPYCFDAYLGLFDATGERRYQEIAESIATFVHDDLRDTPTSPAAAAASYSPMDESMVVNASAYRAWVLFQAEARLGRAQYRQKAEQNLAYILESQRTDGSWLYATDGHGSFIDHFHTCFVLKNLFKINQLLKSPQIAQVIEAGFAYYRENLFHADGMPKSFAIEPRTGIVRLEMYNVAEAITFGALVGEQIPAAFDLARRLAAFLIEKGQLADGHFVTRVYAGGLRHTFPFLRWPQSQLFYALTNLLGTLESSECTQAA